MITGISRPLRVTDRCDRCGAQAKVRATFATGDLHFCGHHATASKESISKKTVQVYDPEGFIDGR